MHAVPQTTSVTTVGGLNLATLSPACHVVLAPLAVIMSRVASLVNAWSDCDVTGVKDTWPARYESICDHEKHLPRNGTVILKFWLNMSKEEHGPSLLQYPEKSAEELTLFEEHIAQLNSETTAS